MLVNFLKYLDDMRATRGLYTSTKGIGLLQKPEKIYLHHPNLYFALSSHNSNTGNIRESFFVNQTAAIGPVSYAVEGDFIIKNDVFEIGGKDKSSKQFRHLKNSYIIADDIEIGQKNKIPLWMFGFLY